MFFALFGLLLSCPLLHKVVEIDTKLWKLFPFNDDDDDDYRSRLLLLTHLSCNKITGLFRIVFALKI